MAFQPNTVSPALAALAARAAGPGPATITPTPPSAPEPPAGQDNPEQLVKQAQLLVQRAILEEHDPEDKLELHQIATAIQKYVAGEQQTRDAAMGSGPGAKVIRKVSGSSY